MRRRDYLLSSVVLTTPLAGCSGAIESGDQDSQTVDELAGNPLTDSGTDSEDSLGKPTIGRDEKPNRLVTLDEVEWMFNNVVENHAPANSLTLVSSIHDNQQFQVRCEASIQSELELIKLMGSLAGAYAGVANLGFGNARMLVNMYNKAGFYNGTFHVLQEWAIASLDHTISSQKYSLRILRTRRGRGKSNSRSGWRTAPSWNILPIDSLSVLQSIP